MVNHTTRILLCLAFLFAGVELLGYFFPSSLTWGFHSFAYLPVWFLVAFVLIAVGTAVLLGRLDPEPVIRRIAGFSDAHTAIFLTAVTVLVLGVAVAFRIEAPLLGDGFFLVKNFSDAFHGTAPLYFRGEPLATAYFWIMFVIVGVPATYREFLQGFLIADCILAVAFILISYWILKLLVSDSRFRLLGFFLILSLPSMQLFFGYVETYAVVLVALSLYVFASVRSVMKGASFTLAAVAFLLMALTHYLTIVLFPSLLFLAFREYRRSGWKRVISGFGVMFGLFFVLLVAINFDVSPYYFSVPHDHYLSMSPPADQANAESQAYTLFSIFHFIDLANLAVLILLPAILLLIFALFERRSPGTLANDVVRFLAAAFVPVLCVLFVIKFDLGAARDWDVFAPYAFLAALAAIAMMAHAIDRLAIRYWTLIVLLTAFHAAAFWSINSDAAATLARDNALLDTHTVSLASYYAASLHRSQYYLQEKQDSLAIESWKRFNRTFPDDLRGYQNLINGWTQGGHAKVEEITTTYEQWLSRAPSDTTLKLVYRNFCLNLGNAYFKTNALTDAARFYEKAISIDPAYPNAHNNLGSVYAQEGRTDSAIEQYRHAITLNPFYGEAFYNLGNALSDKGEVKRAHEYYQKAAQLNVAEAKALLQKSK